MKTQLSSLDLSFLVSELKLLIGARVQKVYQIDERSIRIDLHSREGSKELIVAPHFLSLTQNPYKTGKKPSGFSMLLRKHLSGGIIDSLEQYDFDRIVEIGIKNREDYRLVFEVFSKGNVLLLDKDRKILGLLDWQRWKDRTLGVGKGYEYPPPTVDVKGLGFEGFFGILKKSNKSLVKALAMDLGLGGVYAEEVCLRSKMDKASTTVEEKDAMIVFEKVAELLKSSIDARIVFDKGGEKLDVTPTKLLAYEGYDEKRYAKFGEAVDHYFFELNVEGIKEESEERFSREVDRLESLRKNLEDSTRELEEEIERYKNAGDLIYKRFQELSGVLEGLKQGRVHWMEYLKSLGYSEFKEKEKSFLFEGIWVDIDKSVPENAEIYYKKSKKARQKLAGAEETIKRVLDDLSKAKERKDEGMAVIEKQFEKGETRKKKWYDAFRWFFSSDGFLVVGGKDATTNEVLIKKHLEPSDLVFHSTVHGAPFFIIKNPDKKEIPDSTKEETAQAAVSYSSAWKDGLGSADTYCIKPEQVSKKAPSGQFMGKGAFMIYGEREWFRGVPLGV
ncbi:MAG: NFACT family protein, partial [Candidatus Altiarchaeota archaeon]|nr:NFACT family protein [Candidatus Altiarchaeota archaeon]